MINGLAGTVVAVWIYRWVATLLGFDGTYVFGAFETRADALAIGCLLAVANREHRLPRWLIEKKWLGLVAIAAVAASSAFELNGPRYAWSIVALGFAVVLIQSIAHARTRWYNFLNSRPLYSLGVISYSLYLYHPFAIRLPGALHKLPIQVAFSVGLATASYWIVEKPFLSLKGRISKSTKAVAV
jgi:peptidoglycan/LPS O-acetylase OafA/YrhL